MRMEASVSHMVHVGRNDWRLAKLGDREDKVRQLEVKLEIIGEKGSGFHLCMTAEGCNTYDTWCETIDEAMEDARRAYDAPLDAWKTIEES